VEFIYEGDADKPSPEQLFEWVKSAVLDGDPLLQSQVLTGAENDGREGGVRLSGQTVMYRNTVLGKVTLVGSEVSS